MRRPRLRFRLTWCLVAIAIGAVPLALLVQLRQSQAREAVLRGQLAVEQGLAAERLQLARLAADQLFTLAAREQLSSPPRSGPTPPPLAREPRAQDPAPLRVVEVPEGRGLDPFYKKMVEVWGFPVVASDKVSDYAVLEAAYLIDRMLEKRPDILDALTRNKVRCVVMAYSERTTDVPEHHGMKPKDFWDVRARGLGASRAAPVVSCAEENLLNYPGDPYKGENILIHEFAHAIHSMALRDLDPTFNGRLRKAYDAALKQGLWKGTYAGSSPGEYWAEAVQSWFDCNLVPPDFQHNDVDTREELKAYDPGVAALVAEVFGDGAWRYVPPARRGDTAKGHLAGFDPAKSPRFSWGEAQRKYDEVVAEKRRRREQERQAPAAKKEDRE